MNTLDHLTALLEKDKQFVWDLEDAIQLARLLEGICPDFGCHVALTGGCLYKDGRRKDADVLFYRIRQRKVIDEIGLIAKLREVGFEVVKRSGWVLKVTYEGKPIDMFFPEEAKIDAQGKCIDDHYPAGPRCPECSKDRVQHFDPAYPNVEMWVHKEGQLIACPMKNRIWNLLNVPANLMCPECHQPLDDTILATGDRIYTHSLKNATPIKLKCEKVWPGSAVGISFILPVDPLTGVKMCPDCQEVLYYNQASDVYQHMNNAIILVSSSVPRVMNSNFVGQHIVNQASTVYGFDHIVNPNQLTATINPGTIKDVTDDY